MTTPSVADAAAEMRDAVVAMNEAADAEAKCRADLRAAEERASEAGVRATKARDALVAAAME